MEFVYIKWLDSKSASNEWEYLEEIESLKPVFCESIGFLIESNEEYKTLASTISETQILGRLTIPMQSILKIRKFGGTMSNAKKELIEHVDGREVEFVSIAFGRSYDDDVKRIKGTLEEVLPLLDFDYDDGYGGQELHGYIWYADGTWSDRGEYDGSEWWQHQTRPERNVEINV